MKGKQFLCIKNRGGKYVIDDVIRARDSEEAKKLSNSDFVVEVEEGYFVAFIDELLIDDIREAYLELGYELPKSELGWSDIINDLLEEKVMDEFY